MEWWSPQRRCAGSMKRLLEGELAVLGLLDTNPFPDNPPRLLRAVLYDYHFTNAQTRRRQGTWWTRKRLMTRTVRKARIGYVLQLYARHDCSTFLKALSHPNTL